MSRPWMPLYIADYLADTGHLSTVEHGAYLLLIMHYWQKGGLPNDDARLASIARASLEQWLSIKPALAEFFDNWKHARIDAELAAAEEKYRKRAEAGRKGGSAKAKPEQSSSNAEAGLNQPQPQKITNANALAGDVREQLWREGCEFIQATSGRTGSASRSLIGKWLKSAEDDASLVLGKIREAQREKLADPVAWVTAAVRSRAPPSDRKPRNAGELARQQLKAMSNGNGTSPEARHVIEGNRDADHAGSGIARRFALPTS